MRFKVRGERNRVAEATSGRGRAASDLTIDEKRRSRKDRDKPPPGKGGQQRQQHSPKEERFVERAAVGIGAEESKTAEEDVSRVRRCAG